MIHLVVQAPPLVSTYHALRPASTTDASSGFHLVIQASPPGEYLPAFTTAGG